MGFESGRLSVCRALLLRSRVLSALFAAGKLADPQLAPENALARRQARERCEAAANLAMHFAAVTGERS